jgi:hypothetical protein
MFWIAEGVICSRDGIDGVYGVYDKPNMFDFWESSNCHNMKPLRKF